MKHATLFISCIFLLCLTACQKQNEAVDFANPNDAEEMGDLALNNVAAQMRPYFLRFETAANERGFSFASSLSNLETSFQNIAENNVAGTCSWNSHAPELVTIDIPFWNSANDLSREWVIFHELGHCVLGRPHTEDENENGVCLSLMASGTGSCSTLFNTENRAYYLDELFSQEQ